MHSSARRDDPPATQHIRLPHFASSFVGRESELGALNALVCSTRLVTLTGAAGCGKTRLAHQLARRSGSRLSDGIYWISLASIADPDRLIPTLADALRVSAPSSESILEAVLTSLRLRSSLIVLDNCEHLLDACADIVEHLLAQTPTTVLATSREPLGIPGEARFPVLPMELPPRDLAGETIVEYDAVQLFVDRARLIEPAFTLPSGNSQAVVDLCRKLDGVPLAIELAAARTGVLTVQEILTRMDDALELLRGSERATTSPHQSLRSAIVWSYDLLLPAEQRLFLCLSVFPGGFTLETAQAVCGTDVQPEPRFVELIDSLVRKSLLRANTLDQSSTRYSMLEVLRQFGDEELREHRESDSAQDRLLDYYARVATATEPKLSGPDQQRWLDWIEAEIFNIRAALWWSLRSRKLEAGLRIIVSLYEFWTVRDRLDEALDWLVELLANADEAVPADLRATATAHAGLMSSIRGRPALQAEFGRQAARLAGEMGEEGLRSLIWALVAMSQGARAAGDARSEYELARKVIQLERELGDDYLLGISLSTYSTVPMNLGDLETARSMLDEALTLLRRAADPYRIGQALNFAGDLARCEDDYPHARRLYIEAIQKFGECNALRDLASVYHNLGYTNLRLNDLSRAHDRFQESLRLQLEQQNAPGVAETLIGFGALATQSGLPATGARLMAGGMAHGGERPPTDWPATRKEFEHYSALTLRSLGRAEFDREQETGRLLPLDDLLAYARQLSSDLVRIVARSRANCDLTRRERDIAALIARGLTNGQIAGELFISKRTVEKHVANIFAKLNVASRAGIVLYMLERDVTRPAARRD